MPKTPGLMPLRVLSIFCKVTVLLIGEQLGNKVVGTTFCRDIFKL